MKSPGEILKENATLFVHTESFRGKETEYMAVSEADALKAIDVAVSKEKEKFCKYIEDRIKELDDVIPSIKDESLREIAQERKVELLLIRTKLNN